MARLLAEFQLNQGRPSYLEGASKRHYHIRIFTDDPPEDALTITYQLDPSYTNPIRIVPKGTPDFGEYTTAYGDYEIKVLGRRQKDGNAVELLSSRTLSDALRERYGADASPEVEAAIRDIAEN